MIRLVLAVLLSTAIVATALPAIERGQRQRADTLATDELTDFRDAVDRFAVANDPAPSGTRGASQVLTVRVPDGVTFYVGGDGLTWRRGAYDRRIYSEPALAGNVTLEGPGRYRLQLSLVDDGGATVVVRRFKSESAASRSRVWTSLGRGDVSL